MEASCPPFGSPPALDHNGPETIQFDAFTVQDLETDIYTLFERRASHQPNRIALVDGGVELTYCQLLEKTRQIAQALRARQLAVGVPIGLWMDKSVGAIATLLAILAEGHPYVPLDLAVPAQRNESMLTHAGVNLLIGYRSDLQSAPASIPQLALEQTHANGDTVVYQAAASVNDIAYILYTSGTTGQPKGVYQHQRGVLHDVFQYVHSIHLGADDRHSLLYSLSVIGSIRDVLGTLLTGGSVHLYHPIRQGLPGLAQFIQDQQITIYHSLPLLFRGFLSVARGAYFSSVRLVYLAGDRIYRADVALYRSSFPSTARLYIGIGSTENATIYRQWFIDHQTPLTDELIPVGYAVPDRFMRLVDSTGTEVERGEIGEIVVTSAFLSLGYWRDDERTSHSFTTQGSLRTFRTGDLGRLRPDGLLEFIGRQDRQLKLSGYRVEPAEVEAVLLRAPGVLQTAVLLRSQPTQTCLVAYVVVEYGAIMDQVRQFATEHLPTHMIPVEWEIIEALPRLPNLKIDFNALIDIDTTRCRQREGKTQTNLSQIEQALRAAWCRSASMDSYEQDASWRQGGGSSYNALLLLVDLEGYCQRELPTAWFHVDMRPTQLLAKLTAAPDSPRLNARKSSLSFAVFRPIYGMREGSYRLIQALRKIGRVHLIHYPDLVSQPLDTLFSTLSTDTFLDFIKPQFDHLPTEVHLVGICSGCTIAHEVVHWRETQGRVGGQLIYVDHPPAGEDLRWRTLGTEVWQQRSLRPMRMIRKLSPSIYRFLYAKYIVLTRRDRAEAATRLLTLVTRPSHVKQPVFLIQCADTSAYFHHQESWSQYVSELRTVELACEHGQMFQEGSHFDQLIAILHEALLGPEKV